MNMVQTPDRNNGERRSRSEADARIVTFRTSKVMIINHKFLTTSGTTTTSTTSEANSTFNVIQLSVHHSIKVVAQFYPNQVCQCSVSPILRPQEQY